MRITLAMLLWLAAGLSGSGQLAVAAGQSALPGSQSAESDPDRSPKAQSEDSPPGPGDAAPASGDAAANPRQLFRGKVVPLLDALKRRKIETAEEELKGQVVLETDSGELIPIVPDWRGRAFFQDERLRNRKVELVGYRPAGMPYLKLLMVFTFDAQGERQYTDYWCDICSIPMYEIQPCECCQAPIRLRFQPRELPDYVDRGASDSTSSAHDKP